jgi:lipopolysaccharide export system permease protein
MRILDRYLLRELLTPLGYCLAGILIFWISFDLYSELNEFQKNHLEGRDIVEYYIVLLPEMLVFPLLPVVLLLATLYALTHHARWNEITAIRAAGISLWRLSFPYLGVGLLLSLGALAMNEWWVPRSAERAQQILARHLPNTTPALQAQWEHRVVFTNAREKREWAIGDYNIATYEMIHPFIASTAPDGTRREIYAERGSWANGGWVLTNVQVLDYPPMRGAPPNAPFQTNLLVLSNFSETPRDILTEVKVSRIAGFRQVQKARLSRQEISEYKRLHPEDSPKGTMLDTQLQGHYAAPWTCVVVVLVALPFGAATGRRNVYVGVASSLVICFAYFVSLQVVLALGSRGTVAPWVAGWAPNFLFAMGGVLLTCRIK